MVRSLVLAAALFAVGCGGDDEKSGSQGGGACEAGRVASCPCDGGGEGTQTCAADGSKWGACSCGAASSSPSQHCTGKRDQSAEAPSDRCPVRFSWYDQCPASALPDIPCYQTAGGYYCCYE